MEYLYQSVRYLLPVLVLATAGFGQTSILQIQVVTGEGVVHAPGARSTRGIVVAVTDDAGRPVSGAAVSFHLPEDGPGGTFGSGLRTDVAITDAAGRAGVRSFQANRVPGRFAVRIVASKEQARAGTVSFQYVGEPAGGTAHVRSNRKWIAIAAAAAGGALAAAVASRGSAIPAAAVAPPPTPVAPVVTIGTPTISVGKP